MKAALRRCSRDDKGSLAIAEIPLGLLLLVPAAMIAITLPTWFERHAGARAAADDAARSMVLADSWDEGVAAATTAVQEVESNYSLEPGSLSLELEGALERGGTVTAHVTVTMPMTDIPIIGSVGTYDRTASHSEHVDRFRSFDE